MCKTGESTLYNFIEYKVLIYNACITAIFTMQYRQLVYNGDYLCHAAYSYFVDLLSCIGKVLMDVYYFHDSNAVILRHENEPISNKLWIFCSFLITYFIELKPSTLRPTGLVGNLPSGNDKGLNGFYKGGHAPFWNYLLQRSAFRITLMFKLVSDFSFLFFMLWLLTICCMYFEI